MRLCVMYENMIDKHKTVKDTSVTSDSIYWMSDF